MLYFSTQSSCINTNDVNIILSKLPKNNLLDQINWISHLFALGEREVCHVNVEIIVYVISIVDYLII